MAIATIIYKIINEEYKPKTRVLGLGSRKENIEKAEKIKKALKAIEDAAEREEIDQFQELILTHNILQDRTFHPEEKSQGKYLTTLKKAEKKLKEIDKTISSDSKEKLTYLEFNDKYRKYFVDMHPWNLIRNLEGTIVEEDNAFIGSFLTEDLINSFPTLPEDRINFAKSLIQENKLTSEFLAKRQKIRSELLKLVNTPQNEASTLFLRQLAAYGFIYPRPNRIPEGKISNHLKSIPLDRMEKWRARSKLALRKWSDKSWIQHSYPNLSSELALKGNLDLKYMPPLTSYVEIENEYNDAIKEKTEDKPSPSYTVLTCSDALVNHNFPCFKNGIVQMASQGNCQEYVDGRKKNTLAEYSGDRTQGPASAQSTVDATLARREFEEHCDLMQLWLYKYDPDQKYFDYHSGYLTPKLDQEANCLKLVKEHGKEILTNIQQVRIDNAGQADDHWMTQVPSLALALGSKYDPYRSSTKNNPVMSELCQEFLTLQYQALAQLAVLKSKALGQRVTLVLTPVGGGVFENPNQAISNAINSIQDIIRHGNVDVVLSIYDPYPVSKYKISAMKDTYDPDMIYIEAKGNSLQYIVLDSNGKPIQGTIEEKELKEFKSIPNNEKSLADKIADLIKRDSILFLKDILKVTFQRGHTMTVFQGDTPFKNAPTMTHDAMKNAQPKTGLLENYQNHQKTVTETSSIKTSSETPTSLERFSDNFEEEKEKPQNKQTLMNVEEKNNQTSTNDKDKEKLVKIPTSSNRYTLTSAPTSKGAQTNGEAKSANKDLIAIVTQYKIDAGRSKGKRGNDDTLTDEKIRNADTLIYLLYQNNCETVDGNQAIKNQIDQLLNCKHLVEPTLGMECRFKKMLDQLNGAINKKILQVTNNTSRTIG